MDRRTFTGLAAATVAGVVAAPGIAQAAPASAPRPNPRRKLHIVGHRGASGYRPEHTLASYTLAAHLGADFIEPDLVTTKDGVLVCRHEPEIGGTTDVADRPEFAKRKTTKSIDGAPMTGWFAEDFTLAELKTLRAKERLPELRQHNTTYDGLYEIPTFAEVLRLRRQLSRDLGREIGVYPETKHPTYFRAIGLPLEEKLVPMIRRHGLDDVKAPIYIQSFELKNLIALRRTFGVKAKLVFLTVAEGSPFGDDRTYAELLTRKGMAIYAKDINGLGPDKAQIITEEADGSTGRTTSLVKDAHANGLTVCPWTVRAENANLPTNYRRGTKDEDFGRVLDYFLALYATGIDGVFSDMPDLAVVARDLR